MQPDGPEQAEAEKARNVPLAGVRVLVTRRPDRSDALTLALRGAGAEVSFLPLIDFQRTAADTDLPETVRDLAKGRYAWLVFTSATAVDALALAATDAGTTLAAAVPGLTRVAVVGAGTAAALRRAGVNPALVPAKQSAAGLVAQWPDAGGTGAVKVLLPQADIAAGTLQDGLRAKGLDVHSVVAYRTVTYPADPRTALYPAASDRNVVDVRAAQAELAAGLIGAVVAASPSQVRRLAELQVPLDRCPLVVIGAATEAQARACGIPAAATAEDPGPAAVTAAVGIAVHRAGRNNEPDFDSPVTPNEG